MPKVVAVLEEYEFSAWNIGQGLVPELHARFQARTELKEENRMLSMDVEDLKYEYGRISGTCKWCGRSKAGNTTVDVERSDSGRLMYGCWCGARYVSDRVDNGD